MTKTEYREIQDMLSNAWRHSAYKHGCGTGLRREGWDDAFQVMKSLLHNHSNRPLHLAKVINPDHMGIESAMIATCPYCKGIIYWEQHAQPFYRYCSRCGGEISFEWETYLPAYTNGDDDD